MTLVASLLFATALVASVAVIIMTVDSAIPRITEIIEMEFAPAVRTERRIIFGEVKSRTRVSAAQVIAFPRKHTVGSDYRLAA